MLRTLNTLRDFLDSEQLKWLPGNLQVRTCVLLTQHINRENEPMQTVLQVFDETGTHIGTIVEPAFIPSDRR